jgi:type IV pilus assembly protein PilM
MAAIFGRNKMQPIALDMGADSIKMLQMRGAGPSARVAACARWRFPSAADSPPQERRAAAVTMVRDMLSKGRFRGRRVVSALPCRQLHIKNVRLPGMPDAELRKAVGWEAQERFGFEVSGDRVGFLDAGPVRQGPESRHEVIIIAVPEQTIQEHLALLSDMSLRAERIEPEPVALFRGHERFLKRSSDEAAVSVLVDIGRSATRVVVARGRSIVFIKTIDIGGQSFEKAVASQVGIGEEEAGELRLRINRDRPRPERPGEPGEAAPPPDADAGGVSGTVRDAVRAQVEAVAGEIALCLRYCSVTFRGLRPSRVTLMGGEAYDPAVQGILSEHLGVPCALGHPLKGVDVSAADLGSDRRATMVEWGVCAGLAALQVSPHADEDRHDHHRLSA